MNLKDITLVCAVDKHHAGELHLSYETWLKYKPEIKQMPLLLIYDKDEFWMDDHPGLQRFKKHEGGFSVAPWTMPTAETQREKMLTSLVAGPALHVRTPWYLKIDTDAIAHTRGEWINEDWFKPNDHGKPPVFVSSPWGYTKPAEYIDRLEEWGDKVRPIADFQRLNIFHAPGAKRACHKRIISWLYFGNTAWTREMWQTAYYSGGRLPVPSQDTFLFYCAERTLQHYVRVKFSHLGWGHVGRKTDKLIAKCKAILDG